MSMYRYEIDLPKSYIITIAIFASLGFNLKPHFFLIFVLVELIFLIHSKKLFSFLRVDFFIIVLSGFFYLLLIYFFFNEYISFMIPFAIETYTDVFNIPYITLFKNFETFTLLSILILYICFARRKTSLQNLTLVATIFASLVIYVIQQKGWSYHKIPFFTFSILLLFNIFSTCPKKQIYSIVFIPLILYMMYFNTFIRHSNRHVELKPILKEFPKDASIHILTTDIGGAQPLLNQSKQVWASRFPSLFMLPSMIKNNQKVMDYTFDSIYEDLLKYKPDIIVFPALENRFDYFGYFTSKDERLDIFYKKYYTLRKKDNFIILYKKI